MLYGDAIELLEGMDWSQGFPVSLEDTESTRSVGCIRGLIYASVNLFLDNLADLIVEASRNGDVLLDPRDMGNSGHDHCREEIFTKATSLAIHTCKRTLEVHHKCVQ